MRASFVLGGNVVVRFYVFSIAPLQQLHLGPIQRQCINVPVLKCEAPSHTMKTCCMNSEWKCVGEVQWICQSIGQAPRETGISMVIGPPATSFRLMCPEDGPLRAWRILCWVTGFLLVSEEGGRWPFLTLRTRSWEFPQTFCAISYASRRGLSL